MSDNEEINSAELAAEEILKEAYTEARAEECPQGDQCAVHFRVDEEYLDNESKYGRMISYVGEYVVVTEDNPLRSDPLTLVRKILGLISKLPAKYETAIFHVGEEGVVGDLSGLDPDGILEATRYIHTFDSWSGFQDEHNLAVTSLREGFIDVSKPFRGGQ